MLYDVIHMSYIQFMASINSGESVNVSFPAMMSRLTLLHVAVLQLAIVIQFESGFVVSDVGASSATVSQEFIVSHRFAFNSSICFR